MADNGCKCKSTWIEFSKIYNEYKEYDESSLPPTEIEVSSGDKAIIESRGAKQCKSKTGPGRKNCTVVVDSKSKCVNCKKNGISESGNEDWEVEVGTCKSERVSKKNPGASCNCLECNEGQEDGKLGDQPFDEEGPKEDFTESLTPKYSTGGKITWEELDYSGRVWTPRQEEIQPVTSNKETVQLKGKKWRKYTKRKRRKMKKEHICNQ